LGQQRPTLAHLLGDIVHEVLADRVYRHGFHEGASVGLNIEEELERGRQRIAEPPTRLSLDLAESHCGNGRKQRRAVIVRLIRLVQCRDRDVEVPR